MAALLGVVTPVALHSVWFREKGGGEAELARGRSKIKSGGRRSVKKIGRIGKKSRECDSQRRVGVHGKKSSSSVWSACC